jgi:hypothetical protein
MHDSDVKGTGAFSWRSAILGWRDDSAWRTENSPMNSREAKDFLVQQASEQAAFEQVTLSDLERRMMYFTESDPASCKNPLELNEEFEAAYDTAEYEIKMSSLLSHAQDRLTREEPAKMRTWEEAVGTLRQSDHYLLVLLNVGSTWNAVLKHAWKALTQRRS